VDGDAGGRRQDVGEMKWWGWVVGVCIRILYGVLFLEIAEVGGEKRVGIVVVGTLAGSSSERR
jgi:hypothetical protein